MPDQANSALGRTFGPASAEGSRMAGGKNNEGISTTYDPDLIPRADYYIYIFTISKRAFMVKQPPLFPRLPVPACGPDERYKLVVRLPNLVPQIDREGGVGDLMRRTHRAELVAMSLVNPNNLSLDQDATPAPGTVTGIGNNLTVQGVFWTRNEKPTEDELKAAEGRREKYYRTLLNRARVLENTNPKALEEELNQDYRLAAQYFGEETSWYKAHAAKGVCPNCGESITLGVAFHKNKELDMICIIDPIRAAAAGVKV